MTYNDYFDYWKVESFTKEHGSRYPALDVQDHKDITVPSTIPLTGFQFHLQGFNSVLHMYTQF